MLMNGFIHTDATFPVTLLPAPIRHMYFSKRTSADVFNSRAAFHQLAVHLDSSLFICLHLSAPTLEIDTLLKEGRQLDSANCFSAIMKDCCVQRRTVAWITLPHRLFVLLFLSIYTYRI